MEVVKIEGKNLVKLIKDYEDANKVSNHLRKIYNIKEFYDIATILCFEFKESYIKKRISLVTIPLFLVCILVTFVIFKIYNFLFEDTRSGAAIIIIPYFYFTICALIAIKLNKIIRLKIYQKYYSNNIVYVSFIYQFPLRFIVSSIVDDEVVINKEYLHMIDAYITNLNGRTSYNVLDNEQNIIYNYEILSFKINNMFNDIFYKMYINPYGTTTYNYYWDKKKLYKYAKEVDQSTLLPYVNKKFISKMSEHVI